MGGRWSRVGMSIAILDAARYDPDPRSYPRPSINHTTSRWREPACHYSRRRLVEIESWTLLGGEGEVHESMPIACCSAGHLRFGRGYRDVVLGNAVTLASWPRRAKGSRGESPQWYVSICNDAVSRIIVS